MILKRLKIETRLGNYTNCYVIADEEKKEAMVIDPAGDVNKITETLNLLNTDLKYIYLTHCHADHTGAFENLRDVTGSKVLIHRDEAENLQNPIVNLSGICGTKNSEIGADSRVDEGDTLHVGDIEFNVIHTPGHTSRGKLFVCKRSKLAIYRRYFI